MEQTKEQLLEEISRLRNRVRELQLSNNNGFMEDHMLFERQKVNELQMGFESTLLICEVINSGKDFRIDVATPAVLKNNVVDGIIRKGNTISEVFPLASKSGLISAMNSVYNSGHPEYKIFSHFNDKKITGWWSYNIFKLPDSKIAIIQNEVSVFHNMLCVGFVGLCLEKMSKGGKEKQEAVIIGLLKKYNINLAVLARYMQILTPEFLVDFANPIINIQENGG